MSENFTTEDNAARYNNLLNSVGVAHYRSSRMVKTKINFQDGQDYSYFSCDIGAYTYSFRSLQKMMDFINQELDK